MGVGSYPIILVVPPDIHPYRSQVAAERDGAAEKEGHHPAPLGPVAGSKHLDPTFLQPFDELSGQIEDVMLDGRGSCVDDDVNAPACRRYAWKVG